MLLRVGGIRTTGGWLCPGAKDHPSRDLLAVPVGQAHIERVNSVHRQVDKLKARAEHLLDLFIALRERFAMLQPLAFDAELAKTIGSGPSARGHLILRNTLLQGCILDLVKLTLDNDPRTPSVTNVMATLEDSDVRHLLLKDYAAEIA